MSIASTSRLVRLLSLAFALLVAVLACLALALVSGLFNFSLEELRAQFTKPESQFVEIDDVEIHFLDEGEGPVIVLLHGNLGSLRMWDEWVPQLTADFRVIRMDFTGHGLTAPDPAADGPTEYVDHGIERLEMLLETLDVDRYALVGTSFSGITAFRLAARRPENVQALMLINSGGLPRTAETDPNRQRENALLWWAYGHYFPRRRIVTMLESLTGEDFQVSRELVDEYFRLQNLRGRQREQRLGAARYSPGAVFETLASIRQPVSVLWGADNAALPPAQAAVLADALPNAHVETSIYEGVGHLLPIESPERAVYDLRRLLDRAGFSSPTSALAVDR